MYLLLASNCNKDIYKDINQANHFYVDLPQEIQLEGPHSIALREIFYKGYIPTIINECIVIDPNPKFEEFSNIYTNKKFKNISEVPYFTVTGDNTVTYSYKIPFAEARIKYQLTLILSPFMINGVVKDGYLQFKQTFNNVDMKKEVDTSKWDVHCDHITIKIPRKEYKNKKELISTINRLLESTGVSFHFTNQGMLKVVTKHFESLTLGNDLENILGFDDFLIYDGDESTHDIELNRGIYTFFVYCNIVKDTLVGDVYAPLLKVVNYEKNDKPNAHAIIQDPQYMPLNRQVLKNIEIQICSDTGELIPFQEGKTSLLVEIKKDINETI